MHELHANYRGGTLELPRDVQANQILIDPEYVGRLAARRGLGQFYLTAASINEGWPNLPAPLSDETYYDQEDAAHEAEKRAELYDDGGDDDDYESPL